MSKSTDLCEICEICEKLKGKAQERRIFIKNQLP